MARGLIKEGALVRLKSGTEGWVKGQVVEYFDVFPTVGGYIYGGGMAPGYKVHILEGKHKGETLRMPENYVEPISPESARREQIIEFDRSHTLDEVKRLAREKGVSTSGAKKEIIARLISLEETEEYNPANIQLLASTEGDPIKKFCCRQCGECAPKELLEEGRFLDRISWLRSHYKDKHPGMWGKMSPMTVEDFEPVSPEYRHLASLVSEPLPQEAY